MLQSDWSKFTNSPNCSSFWPEVSCQPALRRFGLVPLRWSTMFETTAAHGIFSSSVLTGPSASVGITAALIQFTFKAAPGWRLKGNCSRATGNQRPVSTTASGIEVPHMTGGLCVYVVDASRSRPVKVDGWWAFIVQLQTVSSSSCPCIIITSLIMYWLFLSALQSVLGWLSKALINPNNYYYYHYLLSCV